MGSVLSYSGISTKIRAMSSHLVTDEQLQEIVRFSDVPQVAAYLKKTPEYAKAWSDLDENNLHRGEIEKLLKKSIFGNFSRIYNFAKQGAAQVPGTLFQALRNPCSERDHDKSLWITEAPILWI